MFGNLALEGLQLVAIGKRFEQQQVDHLFERGPAGQILGQISPINQFPLGTVDITDFCAGDGYSSKSRIENRCTGIFHGSPLFFDVMTESVAERPMDSRWYSFQFVCQWVKPPAIDPACPFRHVAILH